MLNETTTEAQSTILIAKDAKSEVQEPLTMADFEIQTTNQKIDAAENPSNTGDQADEENPKEQIAQEDEVDYQGLTKEDRKEVDQLKKRDAEVRAHEMAHLAAAGGLATGPYYEYQQGPDSKQYVVGGHVNIDTSPGNTPEETLLKASRIRAAAMAPIDPSSQDRIVAAQAARMEATARAELASDKIQSKLDEVTEDREVPEENQEDSGYFNPDAPMFTPSSEDTSQISSTAASITVAPRKSTAEIYASGFSSIHPVNEENDSSGTRIGLLTQECLFC